MNDEGICSICSGWSSTERNWEDLERAFVQKIDSLRGSAEYDAALMMSGGKDSAYLAWLLKREYGLNILGITIDNNFEYAETFERAAEIADALEISHLQFKPTPGRVNEFYRFIMTNPALREKDCGQLCLYCGKFLLDQGLNFVSHMGIPAVFVGYNPDQLFGMGKMLEFETELPRQRQQEAILRKMTHQFNKALNLAAEAELHGIVPFFEDSPSSFQVIYPFQYLPYKPNDMMETVIRELNWKPISAFSKGTYIASGCKLLKLMAFIARENSVSTYMDFEFSNQIRQGLLTREMLKDFYDGLEEDESFYIEVLEKLGINLSLCVPGADKLCRQVNDNSPEKPL